ncbi:MAG: hypothetical protein ABJA82_14415, partial [Myxococcales bacterium]
PRQVIPNSPANQASDRSRIAGPDRNLGEKWLNVRRGLEGKSGVGGRGAGDSVGPATGVS